MFLAALVLLKNPLEITEKRKEEKEKEKRRKTRMI